MRTVHLQKNSVAKFQPDTVISAFDMRAQVIKFLQCQTDVSLTENLKHTFIREQDVFLFCLSCREAQW